MPLYSSYACDLVTPWAATWARRAGSPAASASRTAIADFSPADALPVVPPGLSATRSAAITAFVFPPCAFSAARLAGDGLDRYTIASGRSALMAPRNAPVGAPVAFLSVLVLARLMASLAVMLVAKAYRPIRDSTGTRTRRRIRWRIDLRRKPMALAPESEWKRM